MLLYDCTKNKYSIFITSEKTFSNKTSALLLNCYFTTREKMSGCCCYAVVSTSEVGVIERMGKFNRLAEVCYSCMMFFNLREVVFIRLVAFGYAALWNMWLVRFLFEFRNLKWIWKPKRRTTSLSMCSSQFSTRFKKYDGIKSS